MVISSTENLEATVNQTSNYEKMSIDKMDPVKNKKVVEKLRDASDTWGFFQVVNHAANWRDYIFFKMAHYPPSPEEFPRPCREILMDYSKHMMKLGCSLLGLLSEGLGLDHFHLKDMDCAEGLGVLALYYPACPQPELTIGTNKYSAVFLQDHIGGLQVLHQNQWVDVPPTRGALVVKIGDLLQASSLFIF
uniref:Desacetoxyvindoline 4-hydroxylase n=1 Tax=Solanum tuberosum TaxID=4113 RepID=M0ZQP0_SOLTU